ncbi:class I SAM-dependent DNA methyltransferase [Streptomyces kasugaensis]|uniref:site-specific DNA-methyltransferase (adenine-specific) n=1 Tax=Streptomyces kasugaensis TaxID=1946 RepID=A0A4V2JIZ9_STRKA|nr:DNA methyltransferase [Streptomyces kasugaensis]TBO60581.1 class I SAM-dependent DNA methyltransferase [Streptomyces kasugaensis]
MTYDSLVNHGDYLSPHYLAEVLPKDLKAKDGLLTRWAAFEETERRRHADAVADAARQGLGPDSVPPRVRTPREGLRALYGPYFAGRAALAEDAAALAAPDALEPEGWRKRYTESHLDTLRALGYTDAHEQTATVHRADREYAVEVLHAEPGLYAVACGWTTEPDAALDPDAAGRLLHRVETETSAPDLLDAKALTDFLFTCDAPPRHVLLLVGGVVVLADRLAWPEGRYLSADLDAALHRRDDRHGGELDILAALFGADALRVPAEGGTAPLAAFLDRSSKHAVGVSTELREGLRLSVEWIANEVLDRLREPENGVTPGDLDDPARLAKELSRESLRYLYRILFLLYAEASPALGILPSDYPEYEQGYGLQRLGDLVLRDLVGERSRSGFHLYESLDLLFEKVEKGHRRYGTEPEDLVAEAAAREAAQAESEAADMLAGGTITQAEYTERVREADRARRAAARSTSAGLRFEALRSELFTKEAVRLISDDQIENPAYEGGEGEKRRPFLDTRLRNETLHKVLRRLMLTKGKGRERGGFISYAQLGINQLGAVYEGLMSYTGFIAEEELYEVAKGGDPSGGSWMVPESRVRTGDYDDALFVKRTNEETGRLERVPHPKGSFVYRLAGRDRQTSASYYTPKSLTEVTVELALRHRLDQDGTTSPARELLEWKICEPALGSGAFLNEAIDQVAAEYLRRRERELGRRIDPELRQVELQKAKAYIALHNAYGVDLNATAVELAEVSLWLNSMHPGMRAPWFGLHLRRGNSLIGAGRKVYQADALPGGGWLAKKNTLPPKDLPFRDGPLPEGAVHQFLLPAIGWGAVAGEPEAKKLSEDEAKALGQWRKGVQKAPKGPKPFQERGDETDEARRKRYDRWRKAADKTELGRLQGVARRAEFLWSLVATRLELSERAVSRRVDVWGADWLEQSAEAEDKQKVLDDLTRHGTPYWRLKTVMDAWCALWFWPLDKTGELDGTDPVYGTGGALVDESSVPGLLGGGTVEPAATVASVRPVEPPSGPAPGDQLWRTAGLFDDPDGEQEELGEGLGAGASKRSVPAARRAVGRPPERTTVPLQRLGDWLDFLESLLGRVDMPEQSLLSGIENLSPDEALELLADVEDRLEGFLGMRPATQLPFRYPWLNTVEDIAGTTEKDIKAEDGHGFFHWELHFAHVFRGPGGGFDLQVGNPPWVRPRWEEATVLAELDPWFKLEDKPSVALWRERKAAVLDQAGAPQYFLRELASTTALAEWLGSAVSYPVLRGTQPDLYRAFMCRAWVNLGPRGMAGLVHPDTHLWGAKEGSIRAAVYPRLRLHAGFVNVGNWAFEASRNTEFGVHIYGAPQQEIGFDNLSRLYSVEPVVASLAHDGEGEVPGMKCDGAWDLRPHLARVVRIAEGTLADWQSLTGETDSPAREAALLQPVTTAEQGAIKALSAVTSRVGQHGARITRGFDEANGKKDGFIAWNTSQPESLSGLVLQGPHFGIATPFSKQPKVPCRGNHDWVSFDLTNLPMSLVPRANYVRPETCSLVRYEGEQDRWLDHYRVGDEWRPSREEWETRSDVLTVDELKLGEREQQDLLRRRLWQPRPYTRFYRLAWRRMIPFNTERSLFAALIPPGPAHLYGVNSMAFQNNRETVLNAGFWSALLLDYVLRITGRADLLASGARTMPYADPAHSLSSPLLLRTLRLNCLTDAYAPLWDELYDMAWSGYEDWAVEWPDLAPLAAGIQKTWEYGTPLRTEYERRAALVEIDALVAVWLGMSADELIAIHKARYAILADRESNMWFDVKGRQLAQDSYAHGHGQTKEHYEHFLAYQKKERPEPPEGYTAPFYKADREAEMRAAHAYFSARLQEAVDKGKWTSPTA